MVQQVFTGRSSQGLAFPSGLTRPQLTRYSLFENFVRKPGINADILSTTEAVRMIANPDFEVLGTNMTSALSTLSTGGGLRLTTAGADADSAILLPHLDANQSAWSVADWSVDDEVAWTLAMASTAVITHQAFWAGLKLTNTPVTATDADQVFFRAENGVNGQRFQCITSAAGVDEALDSGVAFAATTAYRLEIEIDSFRVPRFFINGKHVATGAAMTTAIDLIPYAGILADGDAVAKAFDVRLIAMSKLFNN